MLALFSMKKVIWAVGSTVAGANDTQADARFVTKALSTGSDEVVASTAAQSKSASGAIRKVAAIIATDLRAISDQLRGIARAKGIKIAVRKASSSDARYSDAAFIEHEIQSHLKAIALYEDESTSSDAQMRAFAQKILPQLQRHLALLRSLQTKD